MATVVCRFGGIMPGGAPVYLTRPKAVEIVTSGIGNTVSSYTAQGGETLTVYADADVRMDVAASPVANAAPNAALGPDTREYIAAGLWRDFGPLQPGDRVAFTDV